MVAVMSASYSTVPDVDGHDFTSLPVGTYIVRAGHAARLVSDSSHSAREWDLGANVIQNGSFEEPIFGERDGVGVGDTSLVGWTVTAHSVDYVTAWQASERTVEHRPGWHSWIWSNRSNVDDHSRSAISRDIRSGDQLYCSSHDQEVVGVGGHTKRAT